MSQTGSTMEPARERILIAGPPLRGYLRAIGSAFAGQNLETRILEWKYPHRNLVQDAAFYAFKAYRDRLSKTQTVADSLALEREIERFSPDIMLVMKAAMITPKARELMSKMGTKKVLWAYDNVKTFPIISRTASDYDFIYTYEPDDVLVLSRETSARFLPMAYDPDAYSPEERAGGARWDLSFVGSLRDVPVRKRTVQRVADRFRDRRIGVWTDTLHWYSHRRLNDLRFKGSRKNIDLTARTLEHKEINDIYNGSAICLNIHHPQSINAPNPRSFEILGSGGLLLTDRKLDIIEGFESGEGYRYYSSTDELLEMVQEYLEDDEKRAKLAAKGHSIVEKSHKFSDRARTILADVNR